MIASDIQLQHKVHEVVRLLMQRPITEALAMQVEEIEGFEHLEIEDGNWVGFEEDETMGGERHGPAYPWGRNGEYFITYRWTVSSYRAISGSRWADAVPERFDS